MCFVETKNFKRRKSLWHTHVEYAEVAKKRLVLDVEVVEHSIGGKHVLIVKALSKFNVMFVAESVKSMIKRKENTYGRYMCRLQI